MPPFRSSWEPHAPTVQKMSDEGPPKKLKRDAAVRLVVSVWAHGEINDTSKYTIISIILVLINNGTEQF